MPIVVNVHEAKTHFSRLLEQAHRGEEVIVAKAGQPYARLVALVDPAVQPRTPGKLGGVVGPEFMEPLPESELEAWESA